jgi:2-dehydropantoate 2-reductase
MNSFKNILVMGAGGVGGYFGGRLAQRTSVDVTFIARGPHLRAIQKNGLQIKSIDEDATLDVSAFDDPQKAPNPDLILFAVKSFDTPAAIDALIPVVGDETQILSIQNGIENYPKLLDVFGTERVIPGFCKIGTGIEKPGVIRHKKFGEITVGGKDGQISPRLKKLEALFSEAEIPIHISKEIERRIWLKFAWNAVLNMLTALTQVTVEQLFEYEESEALCHQVFDEVRMVAAEEGIELTDDDEQQMMASARQLDGFTTSTYQDRQKGKKMEYEAFNGAVVRLAEKHNIEVPTNQMLYALFKLIDISSDNNNA